MFSFFRHTFRQWTRSVSKPAAVPKPPVRRLQCESLEDRLVPSITSASSLVNSTRGATASQSATATSSNGNSVVVWTETQGNNNGDIMAQRYDALGHKVGGEMLVAGSRNPQHNAAVA